jgi:hypothetical protein
MPETSGVAHLQGRMEFVETQLHAFKGEATSVIVGERLGKSQGRQTQIERSVVHEIGMIGRRDCRSLFFRRYCLAW